MISSLSTRSQNGMAMPFCFQGPILSRIFLFLTLLVFYIEPVSTFLPKHSFMRNSDVSQYGWLDKAFANEDISTPDRTAYGLTGGTPKPSVEVIICGKKTKAFPGQKMRSVVQSVRAPIDFDCGNGVCGTCISMVNGKKTKLCKFTVPKKGIINIESIR